MKTCISDSRKILVKKIQSFSFYVFEKNCLEIIALKVSIDKKTVSTL